MLGISITAPLLGALTQRETVWSLGRRKRDAMHDEVLIADFPPTWLFESFSSEEIERAIWMAPAVSVYPFVMTGNRIVWICVARIGRFQKYSRIIDVSRFYEKMSGWTVGLSSWIVED
jgi:hypothetical protein